MQAEKFRATQGPLKKRYRTSAERPSSFRRPKGTADDSTITCKIETGAA